ncbi:hypothetical protein TeGR_g11291 [Tetraparma gracilis]|uniref:Fe2OG dioxygenase domain-containing protein n=1 Tax=Tetraparma gracilis TaxID=2962635 RepID=A0ABQ6MTV4_9STRA|nr:hypothetical protein TeGR_g11291 [Tetraparma gracilis]
MLPAPAPLALADLQHALGPFCRYLPPEDDFPLSTCFSCAQNCLGDPERQRLLQQLCLEVKQAEEREGEAPVRKSNVGGFHSRTYLIPRSPDATGNADPTPAARIAELLGPVATACVERFHATVKPSSQGQRLRQFKDAQFWVNVMESSDEPEPGQAAESYMLTEDEFRGRVQSEPQPGQAAESYMLTEDEFRGRVQRFVDDSEPDAEADDESSPHHHALHDHTGATYSGCYYVLSPPAAPPLLLRPYVSTDDGPSTAYFIPLPATEDASYVFAGHTPHAVPRFRGGGTRISIAWNFFVGSERSGGYRPAY